MMHTIRRPLASIQNVLPFPLPVLATGAPEEAANRKRNGNLEFNLNCLFRCHHVSRLVMFALVQRWKNGRRLALSY